MNSNTCQDRSTVWVQAVVNGSAIAVPAFQIREMVTLDEGVARPGAAAEVRGLLNLRGRVISLLDLRVILGQPSAIAELAQLCENLVQRKHDHERWLGALENSVRESTPFALARDPTQCAFGKWYASFRTDNAVLRMQLAKLDGPHRAIHALADEVLSLDATGSRNQALERLEHAKTGVLKQLLQLLDDTMVVMKDEHREIVLVLDRASPAFGVLVDAVVGVRSISPSQIETVECGVLGDIEDCMFGLSQVEGITHLLIDLERVLAQGGAGRSLSGSGKAEAANRLLADLSRSDEASPMGRPTLPAVERIEERLSSDGPSPVRHSGVVSAKPSEEDEELLSPARRA